MSPLKVATIVVVVVSLLLLLLFENDRCQGRVKTPFSTYYKRKWFSLSAYNLWASMAAKWPVRPIYRNVRSIFPGSVLLQQNWQKIRQEALGIMQNGLNKSIKDDPFFTEIAPEGWTRFYFKWYKKSIDPAAEKYAPFTTSLLKQLPEVKLAMFSILGPKSKITPHRGPFRGALRYHLGLSCPKAEGCQIQVDGQPYHWRDGEDVVFDDTFMHSVENPTDETRIILFCDVARPMRSKGADRFNNWICDTFGHLSTKLNDKQEKVESTQ